MTSRQQKTVFILLVMALCFQTYVIYDQGEPYPAVYAPGFGASAEPPDSYVKTEFKFFFADGDVKDYEARDVLSQFPSAFWGAISKSFRPIVSQDSRPHRKLHRIFPGLAYSRYSRDKYKPEVMNWFKHQAIRLCGRYDLTSVEVHWQRFSFPDNKYIESVGVYEVSNADVK